MKLNSLKTHLKDFGKSIKNADPVKEPLVESKPQPTFSPFIVNKVAGGDIKWKPVDRIAASMFYKASHICKPPIKTSVKEQPKTQKPKKKRMGNKIERVSGPGVMAHVEGSVKLPSVEDMRAISVGDFVKDTDKTITKSQELVDRAVDARAAMEVMTQSYKVSWMEFANSSSQRLLELRQTRIAMEIEMKQLMASLKEVRSFFIGNDYQSERDRLKEFVELCERLQKLKESGFLDKVADTMLSLAP